MFRIVAIIMIVSPLGALGAIAATVAKFGPAAIIPLLKLIALHVLHDAAFHLHRAGDRLPALRHQPLAISALHQGRNLPRAGHQFL